MNRVTLAILLFFSIALGLYWQVQMKQNEQDANADSNIITPDFVAKDLKSINFNSKGDVESRVTADYMEHFATSNLTNFTEPVFLLYPENEKGYWRIAAKQGALDKNVNMVTLHKDVIINAIAPDEPMQKLMTSYLQLDLNTMIMRSDQAIAVEGDDYRLQGVGLYADLNQQTVELLNQVTGIYEAN